MERGEIWWADLAVPFGSMPGYRRPVLIVQSEFLNRSRLNTTIVVVLASNLRRAEMPGSVLLPAQSTGLTKDSVASATQLMSLDRSLLTERVGVLQSKYFARIADNLRLVLDL